MKNYVVALFLVVVVVFMAAPLWCQVTGSLENENCIRQGEFSTQFQFWIQGQFDKQFGWFGWSLVSKNWGEIYPGVSWQPASWLQMGVGMGIEYGQSNPRFGEFLWVGNEKAYFLGFTEHGGSGFWYRAMAMYRMNKSLQVGLMSQHKLGIGPKVEVAIFKPFALWAAALFWNNTTTFFGGLKLGF